MKNLSIALSVALPVVILSSSISIANAADDVSLSESGELEITVTANRREQTTISTLAPISIITRKDIENTQAQDITEILRLQNGVDISRNGGPGTATNIFLRGANSSQVLVLIDGVRVSSATTGSFDFSALPLAQVEKIEIVRGSRTALYGSDAIGGVIEIFTRKKPGFYISGTAGKFGTTGLNLGISNKGEKTAYSLNASRENSDGFSATNSNAGEFAFNPDVDGFRKESINGSLSHQFTSNTKVGASFFISGNEAEFDQGNSDTEIQTLSAFVSSKLTDNWSTKFTVSEASNETISASAFGVSTFDTERLEIDWQNDFKLSANTDLIVGLNHRQTDADVTGFNNFSDDIDNDAIYANLLNRFGKYTLDLSGRYDDQSQAGDEFTGQIAAGYSFTPSTNAYISYGTAFRAPNVNDLFNPGSPSFADPEIFQFAGNPDLDPETSRTIEVGLKTNIGKYNRLDFSVYRTTVDDQIVFQGLNNQLINLEEALLKGIELKLSGQKGKYDWAFGATLQRAFDNDTDVRLVRRPNSKFTIELGAKITPKTRIGLDALISSSRSDSNFSTFPSTDDTLDGYELLNLSLTHNFSKAIKLGIRVENVGDAIYETALGFNTARRGAFFTLSYTD